MAVRAVLITRIGHVVSLGKGGLTGSTAPKISSAVVAFQANREHHGPSQQTRVCRAMGVVTHFASFHSHGRMLKRKGSALIGVALETSFLIPKCLRYKRRPCCHSPCRRKSAVGVVAIGTLHEPRVYRVFKRHRKVGANIGMAAIAKFRLGFGQ